MPMAHDYAAYQQQELRSSRVRAYAAFGPFRFLTIVMMAFTVVLLCLCVACGLMYVADLAEEFTSDARRVLRALIIINLVVHTAILLVDGMSWWRSCLSIIVNVLYLRILRTFPFIRSFNDPLLLVTTLAALLESAMWYWLCVRLMHYTSFFAIISYFVFLWLVPLGLLSSCVLEEERLPGAGSLGGARGFGHESAGSAGNRGGKRKTILNRFVEFLKPPES